MQALSVLIKLAFKGISQEYKEEASGSQEAGLSLMMDS
jgi:hypothetical protein